MELDIKEFWKQSRYPDWLRKRCRKCEAEYYQQTKNNLSIRESKRRADRKYYSTHKEYRNRISNERHRNNKEYANSKNRDRYVANKDYVLNVYVKINLDRYRLHSAKRRALKVTQWDWTITKNSIDELYTKQNHLCAICWCDLDILPSNKRHLDHIYPISKWWLHSLDNLQWTCQRCNCSKWAKIAN